MSPSLLAKCKHCMLKLDLSLPPPLSQDSSTWTRTPFEYVPIASIMPSLCFTPLPCFHDFSHAQ